MTKDEARLEFFEAVAKVALKIRVRERNLIEATGDAYAHAAAEDALDVERRTQIVMEANHDEGQYEEDADTLGMLEAHVGSHFKDEVSYRRFDEEGGNLIVGLMRGEQGELIWWGGHFDRNGRTTVAISTRAEAEALLKGEPE